MSESSSSKSEVWKSPENVIQNILSTLSLEYRTPLSSIVGFSEILLSEKAGTLSEQQTEMLTQIHRTALRLMNLTSELLEIQRASIGQMLLQFEKVDIQSIIQSISSDNFVLDIHSSPPVIDADKYRIKKVIEILINAIAHLPNSSEYGQVIVSAETKNTDLTIRIHAEGKEISYFRDDYANPDLFYSNAVIEQHGGYLDIGKSNGNLQIIISLPISQM